MKRKILFLTFCMFILMTASVSAKEIWVSAGSDGDGTAERPYGTIQKAADVAQAGDTVMIKPGVYYEQVKFKGAGTKENPIIFRASEYGKNKVIITRADKAVREGEVEWTLEDAQRNIYSIPFDHKPMRVLYSSKDKIAADHSSANLLRLKSYEYLKEQKYVGASIATSNSGISYSDFPTLKDGFYYDEENKKLYVRLRADEKYGYLDPNKNLMCISPEALSNITDASGTTYSASFDSLIVDDSYCFGIIGEKAAYTVLYGLTFETPGFTGVHVRGSDVTVSNCWFEGCANAVHGGSEHKLDNYVSDRVTVEYNEWHAWPYAQDVYEMMEEGTCPYLYVTWHGKNMAWSDNCYEVGCLVGQAGENWVIRNNYVHDQLDALSFYAWEQTHEVINGRTRSWDTSSGEIYENRFEDMLDNAIEFESHASGLDVHHNEFINTYEPISVQPLGGPPWPTNIKIHHNIMYQTPERAELYSVNGAFRDSDLDPKMNYDRPRIVKIGMEPSSNWQFPWSPDEMLYPGFTRPAKTLNFADKGIQVYNNIMYSPNAMFACFPGRVGGDRGEKSNMKFSNNIISCLLISSEYANNSPTYNWGIGDLVGATESGRVTAGFEFESNMFIPTNGQTVKDGATVLDNGGVLCKDYKEAGIEGITEQKYEITEDSPAIGKGTEILGDKFKTTDIGPLSPNEKWEIKYSAHAFGDINCDGKIDADDVFAVANAKGKNYGEDGYSSRADLNFDGVVDNDDVQIVTNEYAKSVK